MKKSIYLEIMNDIINNIQAGIYTPGMYLPTEKELMQRYGASRGTIRKAIDELTKKGILSKKENVGSFVCYPRIEKGLSKLTGFSEDIIQRGGIPSSKLISFEEKSPSLVIKEALNMKDNENIYEIIRIRYDNKIAVAREIMNISSRICPNLLDYNLEKESIYHLLENEYHIKLETAIQTVEPSKATKEDIKVLDSKVNDLLLHCIRVSYLNNGVPVEYTETWYRSDRYKFMVTLNR